MTPVRDEPSTETINSLTMPVGAASETKSPEIEFITEYDPRSSAKNLLDGKRVSQDPISKLSVDIESFCIHRAFTPFTHIRPISCATTHLSLGEKMDYKLYCDYRRKVDFSNFYDGCFRTFQERGGTAWQLPSLSQRPPTDIGILDTDEVLIICEDGGYLSQTVYQVLTHLKIKLGCHPESTRIHPPPLPKDFTKDVVERKARHLRSAFEKRPINTKQLGTISTNTPHRKIVIAFRKSIADTLLDLCATHTTLKNVHLLCIPDRDWISGLSYPNPPRPLPFYRNILERAKNAKADSIEVALLHEAYAKYASLFIPLPASIPRQLAISLFKPLKSTDEKIPMGVRVTSENAQRLCSNVEQLPAAIPMTLIRSLQELGAHVRTIPLSQNRNELEVGIQASDEVFLICPDGQVLSQIARRALIEVKQKLGVREGNEKIKGSQGTTQKNSIEARSAFQEAFEEALPPLYDAKKDYPTRPWSRQNALCRRIYITFGNACTRTLGRLWFHNEDSNQKRPLENVYIIHFPEDKEGLKNFLGKEELFYHAAFKHYYSIFRGYRGSEANQLNLASLIDPEYKEAHKDRPFVMPEPQLLTGLYSKIPQISTTHENTFYHIDSFNELLKCSDSFSETQNQVFKKDISTLLQYDVKIWACSSFQSYHERAEQKFPIFSSDRLIPICDDGMVLSQVLYVLLLGLKDKLDGKPFVKEPHGMTYGYDRDNPEDPNYAQKNAALFRAFGVTGRRVGQYERAFGCPFSSVQICNETGHGQRCIYLTFAKSMPAVVNKIANHAPIGCPGHNTHVVCIPDLDWITELTPFQGAIERGDKATLELGSPKHRAIWSALLEKELGDIDVTLRHIAFKEYAKLFYPAEG